MNKTEQFMKDRDEVVALIRSKNLRLQAFMKVNDMNTGLVDLVPVIVPNYPLDEKSYPQEEVNNQVETNTEKETDESNTN